MSNRDPSTAPPPPKEEILRIPSTELLGRAGQLVILHAGREYLLRQTQAGKLILTA